MPDSWQHFQAPEKQSLLLSAPPRLPLQLLIAVSYKFSSVFHQNIQLTCSFSIFQSPIHRIVYINATYLLITTAKARKIFSTLI